MTIAGSTSDQLIRLVRLYIAENKDETREWIEEPQEPLPRDCCGQSCRPCVFDLHHEDLVRWAKECAKRIPKEGSLTLYSYLYPEEEVNSGDCTDAVFSIDEYRSFSLVAIASLSPDTNLYRFAISQGIPNLPIGSHLRTRCLTPLSQ